MSSPQERRRTRIVCISDTHNQTPQLPKGDVLIHAGDLTNQGNFSELQKTVSWLERADFEAKIVVAGNHDITLDATFYEENWAYFHNQRKQNDKDCLALLRNSPSITYLEHEARHVVLTSPSGPQTHFNIFGSPYSPTHGLWAFGYEGHAAQALWHVISPDADIVVTHTPPQGHCDRTVSKNGRAGCEHLLNRLAQIRPRLHVCGHMHEGRGAENVVWKTDGPGHDYVEYNCQYWNDPGEGNKKQSILSLIPEKPAEWSGTRVARSKAKAATRRRSRENTVPPADEHQTRKASLSVSENGSTSTERDESEQLRTCIVNAAIMQNSWGGPKKLNKPIVVDIDLPVWAVDSRREAENRPHN